MALTAAEIGCVIGRSGRNIQRLRAKPPRVQMKVGAGHIELQPNEESQLAGMAAAVTALRRADGSEDLAGLPAGVLIGRGGCT